LNDNPPEAFNHVSDVDPPVDFNAEWMQPTDPYAGLSEEEARECRDFVIKYNQENPQWWVKAAGGEEAWDAMVTRIYRLDESYPNGPWPAGPPPGFN